ncbi:MAG: MoaD/ThiS family protein [Syntrophorhabdaceae bacterium]|nr:MoaD/ThiS family protein [Syntrophorhabdaceae bacterium]
MSINVTLHPYLHDGVEVKMDVEGKTVRECLKAVIKEYPHMEKKLFDKNGKLKGFIEVLVNGKGTTPLELEYPVQDGDSMAVLVFLSGG